ncbi:MAG: Fic family protein [Salibacteraceae bacterium]
MTSSTESRKQAIFDFLAEHPEASSSIIHSGINVKGELITTKRTLTEMVRIGIIKVLGVGRATRYVVNPGHKLLASIDLEKYFETDATKRVVMKDYNFDLPQLLDGFHVFNNLELTHLQALNNIYEQKLNDLPQEIRKKEFERLAIDLIWKSSQIEGNTYSLLETELLIKEQQETKGKTKEEATMILNHKIAIDFITHNLMFIQPLSIAKIESIHRLLVDGLGVDYNIRSRAVGITGTSFRPLDNQFQIREALENMCRLVNNQQDVFTKAFLTLCLISYIQPFNDGNKRTGRIVSNAILMAEGVCPLSFRTVESIDYKKAMLLFYEQNNLQAMKNIFIEQFEFAVETYF